MPSFGNLFIEICTREKRALEMEKKILHSLWSCSAIMIEKKIKSFDAISSAHFLDFGALCNIKIEKNEASKIICRNFLMKI